MQLFEKVKIKAKYRANPLQRKVPSYLTDFFCLPLPQPSDHKNLISSQRPLAQRSIPCLLDMESSVVMYTTCYLDQNTHHMQTSRVLRQHLSLAQFHSLQYSVEYLSYGRYSINVLNK